MGYDAMVVSHALYGRVRWHGAVHLEVEDGLVAHAAEVGVAFQEVVLHPLNIIGACIFVAVQAECAFLCMRFILDSHEEISALCRLRREGVSELQRG